MADNVRYILDKMAPLFKQLEEMEIFSNVSKVFYLFGESHCLSFRMKLRAL